MENFEGSAPENPVNNLNKKTSRPLGLFLGMGLGFVFFAVILITLNYFTILEVNKILPTLFSWMPNQQGKTSITSEKPRVDQEEKAIYGFSLSDLPNININKENITSATMNYTYTCRITDITNVDQSTKKITTYSGIQGMPKEINASKSNNYPPVYISLENGSFRTTTIDSLEKGQLIQVTRAYRFKNKTVENNWFTQRVVILPSQTNPTPTIVSPTQTVNN